MNPWIAKAVFLAAVIALVVIRAPHGNRSRGVKVARSCKTKREAVLLTFTWIGFFIPLVWVASPAFSFAEFPLRLGPLLAGVAFLVFGLWLFHRSHADLGRYWSITLEIREDHRIVTEGVYHRVRHPMYAALFLYSIGLALVIPNWFVGPSYLVPFGTIFAFRVREEERMMLETFGEDYSAYMARTKRIVPGVW